MIISGTGVIEHHRYNSVKVSLNNLYKSNITKMPKENITVSKVEDVKTKIDKLPDNISSKKDMLKQVNELEKYARLKEEIEQYLENNELKESVTEEKIESINRQVAVLINSHKSLLKEKIEQINKQYMNIIEIKKQIDNLYTNSTRNYVREDVSMEEYENVLKRLTSSNQKSLISSEQEYMNRVEQYIIARQIQEDVKKAQQISAAWTILNVPYISQNNNSILNGCEAASLLMALQYKGFLKDIDLRTFAENMPKSTDPFKGFTYDIYGLQPTNVPHWIAPAPLVQYGKDSSGNQDIIDATGYSLDDLDKEIQSGNPVVIYLTSNLKTPKEWIENAPKNIHVLLLTGYNSITKEHIITDPWTGKDGSTKWQVSKEQVESIFNATGQRAIIIR